MTLKQFQDGFYTRVKTAEEAKQRKLQKQKEEAMIQELALSNTIFWTNQKMKRMEGEKDFGDDVDDDESFVDCIINDVGSGGELEMLRTIPECNSSILRILEEEPIFETSATNASTLKSTTKRKKDQTVMNKALASSKSKSRAKRSRHRSKSRGHTRRGSSIKNTIADIRKSIRKDQSKSRDKKNGFNRKKRKVDINGLMKIKNQIERGEKVIRKTNNPQKSKIKKEPSKKSVEEKRTQSLTVEENMQKNILAMTQCFNQQGLNLFEEHIAEETDEKFCGSRDLKYSDRSQIESSARKRGSLQDDERCSALKSNSFIKISMNVGEGDEGVGLPLQEWEPNSGGSQRRIGAKSREIGHRTCKELQRDKVLINKVNNCKKKLKKLVRSGFGFGPKKVAKKVPKSTGSHRRENRRKESRRGSKKRLPAKESRRESKSNRSRSKRLRDVSLELIHEARAAKKGSIVVKDFLEESHKRSIHEPEIFNLR